MRCRSDVCVGLVETPSLDNWPAQLSSQPSLGEIFTDGQVERLAVEWWV